MARLYQRKWLLIRLPVLVAAFAAASMLWLLAFPMPPRQISISTAGTDGAYYQHAQRYAERFAAHGITLEIRTSAGSQQNIDRLHDAARPADLAFLQAGFGYLGTSLDRRERSRVETLANVDIEPLWIFTRDRNMDALAQWRGLRVAIGPPGSGSRRVALRLLEQARVNPGDVSLSALTGLQAAQALRDGQLDGVLMVAAPQAAAVQALLAVPGIQLASLLKSVAIAERNPYLEPRLLSRGAFGLSLPPRDTAVLTTSASLVVRQDVHPALKRLAVAVAMEVHQGSGLFHRAGDFPSLRQIDFPTAPQARDTLVHGLRPLERLLPFWWAHLLQRLLALVLPVMLLACWLMRLIPSYMRWLLESRVNRWYGELKFIENDLGRQAVSGLDLSRFLERLNGIDQALMGFATPRELLARRHTLHQHIEFVRQRIYRMRGR